MYQARDEGGLMKFFFLSWTRCMNRTITYDLA